jgi:hypothetical protein
LGYDEEWAAQPFPIKVVFKGTDQAGPDKDLVAARAEPDRNCLQEPLLAFRRDSPYL